MLSINNRELIQELTSEIVKETCYLQRSLAKSGVKLRQQRWIKKNKYKGMIFNLLSVSVPSRAHREIR